MRIAEQSHAAEESRAKWTAELSAREAALTQREDAAAAAARRQQEDLRKRAAHDEQVCPECCPCRQQHGSAAMLEISPFCELTLRRSRCLPVEVLNCLHL